MHDKAPSAAASGHSLPKFLLGLLFGGIPLGIGVTVLCHLWSYSSDDFFAPPLFARVFGSFVALFFVAFGLLGAYAAWQGSRSRLVTGHLAEVWKSVAQPGNGQRNYICRQCGAPLAEAAEVSPSGDAKCSHCGSWFNVRTN